MTALDFFEKQLLTDSSSVIDKTANKFTKFELIQFAEAYNQHELKRFINFLESLVDNRSEVISEKAFEDHQVNKMKG